MDQQKEFLGRGWAYPVALDAGTGSAAEVAYEEDVRQSIRIIIATDRGSRVHAPDFGCGIHELVFTAIDFGGSHPRQGRGDGRAEQV